MELVDADGTRARAGLARLVDETVTWRDVADKKAGLVSVQPLLAQLHEAIEVAKDGGQRKGYRSAPPLHLDPFEVWWRIAWNAAQAVERHPDQTPAEDAETNLRRWVELAACAGGEELDLCADTLHVWADEIEGLLYPSTRKEITEACPVCGARHVWRWDGEDRVRAAALVAVLSATTAPKVVCQAEACGNVWEGPQLVDLAAVLNPL